MADWYISSAGYTAVTAWAATTAYSVGAIRRPTAAIYGSERVYRCTTAGTSGGTEPSVAGGNPWNLSKNGTTADGTVVWTEVTGQATYNWSAPFARLATICLQAVGPNYVGGATVVAGGTGYAVGNVLSISGGTTLHGDPNYIRVATISGSAVATVTVLSGGSYAAAPPNGSASTAITGTGTGATFNVAGLNYGVAAGDTFYVSHDHAETQAVNMTLINPGTSASPCRILCVDRTGSVPPVSADLATTATVTTTGAFTITVAGYVYIEGVAFSAATGANASGLNIAFFAGAMYLKNCALKKASTLPGVILLTGNTTNTVFNLVLDNTTFEFGATGDQIAVRAMGFHWKNTANAIAGATIPTTLFGANANMTGVRLIEGVDLSALGSGKTLVGAITSTGSFIFKDCKLGSSVTVAATPANAYSTTTDLIRCDSGATNYRTERYTYMGALTTETTIVRTGGASDGVTPISWKVVTTANPEWQAPFECYPISIFNRTVGVPVAVTVQGIWGGGAVPLNDEIWMDVEYLGSSLNPQGSFATTTKADILATGTNLPAGSGTWGGSTTQFALTATVTPQMEGPIWVTVKVAKVSSTFYIDPKITLS